MIESRLNQRGKNHKNRFLQKSWESVRSWKKSSYYMNIIPLPYKWVALASGNLSFLLPQLIMWKKDKNLDSSFLLSLIIESVKHNLRSKMKFIIVENFLSEFTVAPKNIISISIRVKYHKSNLIKSSQKLFWIPHWMQYILPRKYKKFNNCV